MYCWWAGSPLQNLWGSMIKPAEQRERADAMVEPGAPWWSMVDHGGRGRVWGDKASCLGQWTGVWPRGWGCPHARWHIQIGGFLLETILHNLTIRMMSQWPAVTQARGKTKEMANVIHLIVEQDGEFYLNNFSWFPREIDLILIQIQPRNFMNWPELLWTPPHSLIFFCKLDLGKLFWIYTNWLGLPRTHEPPGKNFIRTWQEHGCVQLSTCYKISHNLKTTCTKRVCLIRLDMFRADGTKCHILQQQKSKQLNGAIIARGTNPFTLYFV